MLPHHWFDLTPGEVARWLGPRWRGVLIDTYWEETVRRRKRLPRKPDELFRKMKVQKPLEGQQLYDRMRAVVKEFNKRAKERGVVPPPEPRK